jgi:phage gp46-like protein
MSDLLTFFDGETFASDLATGSTDLSTDDGLATAVVISLFTDARARPDDVLPSEGRAPGDSASIGAAAGPQGLRRNPRGWWGDLVPPAQASEDAPRHRTGSRLWLLSREKQLPEILRKAEEYAREALQWLIEDGVASAIEVEASIPRDGWLALQIVIERNGAANRFEYLWNHHAL